MRRSCRCPTGTRRRRSRRASSRSSADPGSGSVGRRRQPSAKMPTWSSRALLERPLFELIPLRDALERAESLPPGAGATVTASPTHGIESTIELCEGLIARGHPATPHLAAHMIRDRAHLEELLERCRVGRDPERVRRRRGREGSRRDPRRARAAPSDGGAGTSVRGRRRGGLSGRSSVDPGRAYCSRSLKEKQAHATYVTTQMSFDAVRSRAWIARMRDSGVTLPIHLGPPRRGAHPAIAPRGRADRRRRVAPVPPEEPAASPAPRSAGRSRPSGLLRSLGPTLADPEANVRALHLFTFNQVEATVELAAADAGRAQLTGCAAPRRSTKYSANDGRTKTRVVRSSSWWRITCA